MATGRQNHDPRSRQVQRILCGGLRLGFRQDLGTRLYNCVRAGFVYSVRLFYTKMSTNHKLLC
ncbi:hypothetical protein PL11201_10090 [Planktothrix sp. PCC 11201]|nr:hypothetical protein PL11201_10090 [Planktothrix sp. PCC 11201]